MNIIIIERIKEISDIQPRFKWIKEKMWDWKFIAFTAVSFLTLKSAAEQLAMLVIRH